MWGACSSVPLSKVNEIAELVPEDLTMTLEKAFEMDPELTRLMRTMKKRAASYRYGEKAGRIDPQYQHPCGRDHHQRQPLTDHIPVCTAKDSDMPVTQFSMKPVEASGC